MKKINWTSIFEVANNSIIINQITSEQQNCLYIPNSPNFQAWDAAYFTENNLIFFQISCTTKPENKFSELNKQLLKLEEEKLKQNLNLNELMELMSNIYFLLSKF